MNFKQQTNQNQNRKTNMTETEIVQSTNHDKRMARPLGVLVPLIRSDLKEMEKVATEAAETAKLPFLRSIGEKLMEAKSQLPRGDWSSWIKQNFHLSSATAHRCIRIAEVDERKFARDKNLSQRAFIRKHIAPTHNEAGWKSAMQERMDRINVAPLSQPMKDEVAEEKLERKLALELVDIGYRALATKLHPDKRGGSKEAMARLNNVRANLKDCINDW